MLGYGLPPNRKEELSQKPWLHVVILIVYPPLEVGDNHGTQRSD